MKIVIFNPQSEFTPAQQKRLSALGEVTYVESREELAIDSLLEMAKGADILGVDPDPLGGFEKAKPVLTKLMESLPELKAVCLSTTSTGWVDLGYCKERNIIVTNIPGYSRESIAEHTFAFLLNIAKRIFVTDRKTQKGQYTLQMGYELKGKTLGIIGLGSIGSRVAEIANCFGMKVIAYNRSPKTMSGVKMKSMREVLKESHAIALHTTHAPENDNLIGKAELFQMNDGVMIVNLVDRSLVNEKAMAEAIKSGKVMGYAYEAEDLDHGPLAGLENAVGLKGFGWYTKEAMENLMEIWVKNIEKYAT